MTDISATKNEIYEAMNRWRASASKLENENKVLKTAVKSLKLELEETWDLVHQYREDVHSIRRLE